jgi:hypothetical protein
MSCNFCLFQFLYPKGTCFWKLYIGHYHMDIVGFIFRTSKLKMTSNTLNTSFHIGLGRFANDWTCIIQRFKITFKKVTTKSIWIIWKNCVWTYKECNFYQYWNTQSCIHPPTYYVQICQVFSLLWTYLNVMAWVNTLKPTC